MKNALLAAAAMLSLIAACSNQPELTEKTTTTTTSYTAPAPAPEQVEQKKTTTITVQ